MISFIIPAFNEEDYIAATLYSLISSIHDGELGDHSCEIIVADNCSTDDTLGEVKEVAAETGFPIRVTHALIQGVTHARQAGLDIARGEIVCSLDADCLVPEGWLSSCIEALERDLRVVMVSGPYYFPGRPVMNLGAWLFSNIQWLANRGVGASVMGGNHMVWRDVLEAAGGYPTDFKFYGEDTALAQRASKYGLVRFLPKLWVWSSPRRFDGNGTLVTLATYVSNYLSVVIKGGAVTPAHRDYR